MKRRAPTFSISYPSLTQCETGGVKAACLIDFCAYIIFLLLRDRVEKFRRCLSVMWAHTSGGNSDS